MVNRFKNVHKSLFKIFSPLNTDRNNMKVLLCSVLLLYMKNAFFLTFVGVDRSSSW